MRIEWNGKKLTKKKALFLCWKLWEWLAENPGEKKWAWPEWKNNGGKVKSMAHDCPCCEVGHQLHDCPECPLKGFWPKESNFSVACNQNKSPFHLWTKTGEAKYARRIAAAAKRRYEKLGG